MDDINSMIRWLFFLLLSTYFMAANAAPIVEHWDSIKDAYFTDQNVIDANDQITIEAPVQAENSAIVPFSFYVNLVRDQLDKVYVFTDANPILLTATFNMKVPQQSFKVSTRIRLEKNSVVRVIAHTSSGQLLMKTISIKTPGGGCGGGAMTNEAKLRATAGQMRMRLIKTNTQEKESFVLNIKHPMRTGFERTFQGYYAKAWFIQHVDFSIDDKPYFNAVLGPGISADPYFRFDLPAAKNGILQVGIQDNEGKTFQQMFSASN